MNSNYYNLINILRLFQNRRNTIERYVCMYNCTYEFHDAREINIPCEESLRRDAVRESTNDGETWRYTPLEISTYGC